MKLNSLYFLVIFFLASLTGCTTMNKLNPFSTKDKTSLIKPNKVKDDKVKVQKVKCYAWDASGMCSVW